MYLVRKWCTSGNSGRILSSDAPVLLCSKALLRTDIHRGKTVGTGFFTWWKTGESISSGGKPGEKPSDRHTELEIRSLDEELRSTTPTQRVGPETEEGEPQQQDATAQY